MIKSEQNTTDLEAAFLQPDRRIIEYQISYQNKIMGGILAVLFIGSIALLVLIILPKQVIR